MASAPVCNITPQPPIAEPVAPELPTIPVATDLPSALAAINAMRQIIHALTNQLSENNSGSGKTIITGLKPPPKKKHANFTEIVAKRTTDEVVVTDPNSSASVTVKRITGLTFVNPVSKQTWVWK